MQYMNQVQQKCDMSYKIDIAKSSTIKDAKLPYFVVAQILPDDNQDLHVLNKFRKDLTSRYNQKDISCQIDNYTRVAKINFRNSEDAADFLRRS